MLFFEAGVVMVPAFRLLMGFGIAASVLQNMPSPVLDRIQPKLERISIAKGLAGSTAPRAWWNSPNHVQDRGGLDCRGSGHADGILPLA
jgi:flagellar biosynthesis protein FlhB